MEKKKFYRLEHYSKYVRVYVYVYIYVSGIHVVRYNLFGVEWKKKRKGTKKEKQEKKTRRTTVVFAVVYVWIIFKNCIDTRCASMVHMYLRCMYVCMLD